jgi:hypothetical protein
MQTYGGNYKFARTSEFCTINKMFNEDHLKRGGFWCRQKHVMYKWKAYESSRATIIGDSLTKWVRGLKFTDTQATPGLTLEWALERLKRGIIEIKQYEIILLVFGTNNIQKGTHEDAGGIMEQIVSFIKRLNPSAKIGIVGILYRPIDIPEDMLKIEQRDYPLPLYSIPFGSTPGTPYTEMGYADLDPGTYRITMPQPSTSSLSNTTPSNKVPPLHNTANRKDPVHPSEQKRREFNKIFRKVCKKTGCHFLKSGRVVFHDDETLNIHRYADDGLHLNNDGIIALGNYLQGSVASLLDKKRIALPTPNPKANKTVSLK